MKSADKNSPADQKLKATDTETKVIAAPPPSGATGSTLRAGESPSKAILARYIDSRMKQFGIR